MQAPITQAELKELISYDPETGMVERIKRTSNSARLGPAGTVSHHGYLVMHIHGKLYRVHRLIWLYMTGEWPTLMVDHINGARTDNRWANLRQVNNQRNTENARRARSTNQTGLLGASPTREGKFVAVIHSGGKKRHLGTFASADLAHLAYVAAKREMHVGCTI